MYKILINIYLFFIKILRNILFYNVKKLNDKDITFKKFHYLSLLSVYNVKEMIDLDVPWWTYESFNFLKDYLNDKTKLEAFEYGPGASSFWLKKYYKRIDFVEYDKTFYKYFEKLIENENKIKGQLIIPNKSEEVNFFSEKPGWEGYDFENYVKSISKEKKKYDIIVIDGRCRKQAFEYSKNFLNKSGIIIFDNSSRKRYSSIYNTNLRFKKFYGCVPTLPFKDETTIFFND